MTWTDDVKSLVLTLLRWLLGLAVAVVGVVMIFHTDIPKWGVAVALCGAFLVDPADIKAFFAWAVSAIGQFLRKPGNTP